MPRLKSSPLTITNTSRTTWWISSETRFWLSFLNIARAGLLQRDSSIWASADGRSAGPGYGKRLIGVGAVENRQMGLLHTRQS
jgi:hypothetical protein